MTNTILSQLKEAQSVLENFLSDRENLELIHRSAEFFVKSIKDGGKIFSCGNGGSQCDAMHFAEELTGKFRNERRALPAISISDPSHTTCTANDYGFEYIFSRHIEALGKKEDTLLAISTSGNSPNILEAAKSAKNIGMKVIALTGKSGGKLAELSDLEIRVPHMGYSDRIQEVHIKVIHIFILLIEEMLVE